MVDLATITQACAGFARVGVAVSGGGDSVAALVLAVQALGAARVCAVSVDHGLREGSAAEAQGVAVLCKRLGVAHDTLVWNRGERGNLQGAARAARRDLIAGWARGRVDAVILAHTQDDQAETVLLNIARGSAVDGLAAMPARLTRDGVVWLRPLLGVRRADLRDVLRAQGIGWVDDPSNDNPAFDRVRLRQAQPALDAFGLTTGTLAALAGHMQMARQVLWADAARLFDAHVTEDRGTARVAGDLLEAAPESVERVLATLIRGLSGGAYKPRREALRRVLDLRAGTLAGVVIMADGPGLRLFREHAAVAGTRAPATGLWDGRWTATGPDRGAHIAPLGEGGVRLLSQQAARGLHPHWRDTGLPRLALLAQPGLWYEDSLIAAPLACWPNGWHVRARPLAALFKPTGESH